MMKMQLSITLKYLIMNILTIKKRIYLSARKRHNIIRKNDKDDETIKTTRQIKSFFRSRDNSFVKFLIVILSFHVAR